MANLTSEKLSTVINSLINLSTSVDNFVYKFTIPDADLDLPTTTLFKSKIKKL